MSFERILCHNDGVNSKIGKNPAVVDNNLLIDGVFDNQTMGGEVNDPLPVRLIAQVHDQRVDPNEDLQPPETWKPYQTLFYASETLKEHKIRTIGNLRRHLEEANILPYRTLVRTHEVRKQGKHKTQAPKLPGFFVLFLSPPGHKPEREIKPDIIEAIIGSPIFSLLETPGGKPKLETGEWSKDHTPETVWEKLARSHDNLCLSLSYREGEQFVPLDAFPTSWKAKIAFKAKKGSLSPSTEKETEEEKPTKKVTPEKGQGEIQLDLFGLPQAKDSSGKKKKKPERQTAIQRFSELFRSKNSKPIVRDKALWERFHGLKFESKYNKDKKATSTLEQQAQMFYRRCDLAEIADSEGLWREDVLQQIEDGEIRVGLNPVGEDGVCRWIALDIDRGDFPTIAETYGVNEADLLHNSFWINLPGEPGLIWERSSSGGVHAFVFFSDYINAEAGIAYGKDLIQKFKFPEETEIFPKQKKADVGNFVWLPPLRAIDCSWREGERHGFMKPDALLSVSPISIDDISQETHIESVIPSQTHEDAQERTIEKNKGKSTSKKGKEKIEAVFVRCVEKIKPVPEGKRHPALTREVGKLYRRNHEINWAELLNRHFSSPLSDAEVTDIHKNLLKKETAKAKEKEATKAKEEEILKELKGRLRQLHGVESFGGISVFDDYLEAEGDGPGFEHFELGPAFTAKGTGETRLEIRFSKKYQHLHTVEDLSFEKRPKGCSFEGEWNPKNCTSILVDFDCLQDIGNPRIAINSIAKATRLAIPCGEGEKKVWRSVVPPLLRTIQAFYEHNIMTSSKKEDLLTVQFINLLLSRYGRKEINNEEPLEVVQEKLTYWKGDFYFKWDHTFQDLATRRSDFLPFKKEIGKNINSLQGCTTSNTWRVGGNSKEGKEKPKKGVIRSAKLATYTLLKLGFDFPASKEKKPTTAEGTPDYDGKAAADNGRRE